MKPMHKILAMLATLLVAVTASAQEWQDAQLGHVAPDKGYESTDLVTTAYVFIWLMVLGFVASVWRRGTRVEREIEDLRRAIERRAAKG
jgi:CcmD family protein